MEVSDVMLKAAEIILTAADIVLQYALYKETKNNRHKSSKH